MCVGFAQTQLQVQRAVTTVGRLPKMAAHVVLVQNQPERAAAMRGKALIFSALLLALDISATSAQSLFEQRAKCQRYADDFVLNYFEKHKIIRYKSNYHAKLGNCYVLAEFDKSFKNEYFSELHEQLFDAITKEELAFTFDGKRQDGSHKKFGLIFDKFSKEYNNKMYDYDTAEKYIADKMKTER